ncbi:hematopoietic prostaglandin D synthase-like [Orbicella faveolata]|uniref:hematopoietic prostaglandin D synthase-like n=1 Tax=Orbicella faveolata TaxID=48498 RepID=UPI0009E52A55|nr:hematopoietic prostaglandin D synthase-like [Orbicella faveolata]
MATTYKLTYFNLRARAEPTRLVFAYAGVDYEDIRISFDNQADWLPLKNSGKCPFGQIPLLEVEGVTLSQSMTILRFVAKRHGLMPSTDLQQALADMFSEGVYDLENEIVRAVVCTNPEEQKALMEKFEKESLPKACKYLEKFLEKNPKDEVYCVGNKLSFADICFFAFFNSYIAKGKPEVPDVLKGLPRLTALYKKVRDEPKLQAWLEKRPQTSL